MAVKKEIAVDIRDVILEHLAELERDLAWLSRKTEIPYATLYYCFVRKQFKVSSVNLGKIKQFLPDLKSEKEKK